MGPQFIDRKRGDLVSLIELSPIFKKQGTVNARIANAGEKIATVLSSGATETENTAKDGDYIVTNPSGEQYIISGEKFTARYKSTDDYGVFEAKGYCRAVQNPFGNDIEILASWGEPQFGDQNCWVADTCNENGECDGEPYLIENQAFQETYKMV